MIGRLLFLIAFCMAFVVILPAADVPLDDLHQYINDTLHQDTAGFLKGFVRDQGKIWTSPLRFGKKDLAFWGPVAAAGLLTVAYDEKIFASVSEYKSSHRWVRTLSPVLNHGGEDVTVIGTGVAFYAGGLIFKDPKAKQTGILAMQSLMHASIVGNVVKLFTGRQRPRYDSADSDWHWFPASLQAFGEGPRDKYSSFVSGHTISAWSVATVVAMQYRNRPVVPVLCYTLAAGSGLARVTEGAHWLSDVICGAALGYSIGRFVVRNRQNTKWKIFPGKRDNVIYLTGIYEIGYK